MNQKRVLFLCTGNSARSQLAEALLRHIGGERFTAASAGTEPRAAVHPDALATLEHHGVPAAGLAPKHIATFDGAAPFDLVITVCDRAHHACPVMPGATMLHWSFPDPAEVVAATERRRAFEGVFAELSARIAELVRA